VKARREALQFGYPSGFGVWIEEDIAFHGTIYTIIIIVIM